MATEANSADEQDREFSGCILLVYGIPGSGKTLLTESMCSHSSVCPWTMLPLHFDSFYPPDLRSSAAISATDCFRSENVGSFQMKENRQLIVQCLEYLLKLSVSRDQNPSPLPKLWSSFIDYLEENHHITCHRVSTDTTGNTATLRSPGVVVVDDNLHLHSMRYIFYQLAKKYHLGFAEVCICCKVDVALERNARRQVPIPESTILNMEQRLEVPEPAQHSWESRSVVVYNDSQESEKFLQETLVKVRDLIYEAMAKSRKHH